MEKTITNPMSPCTGYNRPRGARQDRRLGVIDLRHRIKSALLMQPDIFFAPKLSQRWRLDCELSHSGGLCGLLKGQT
jgi:hypothetical protein